jgi:hypothetical protein
MVGLGRFELPTSAMSKMPLRFRMCVYVLEKLPNLKVFSEHRELIAFQRLNYCILRIRFLLVTVLE